MSSKKMERQEKKGDMKDEKRGRSDKSTVRRKCCKERRQKCEK